MTFTQNTCIHNAFLRVVYVHRKIDFKKVIKCFNASSDGGALPQVDPWGYLALSYSWRNPVNSTELPLIFRGESDAILVLAR